MRRLLLAIAALAVILPVTAAPRPAEAQMRVSVSFGPHYGYRPYYGYRPVYYGYRPVYYGHPRYYAPRRVFYRHPVHYYAPRRVYYGHPVYRPARAYHGPRCTVRTVRTWGPWGYERRTIRRCWR